MKILETSEIPQNQVGFPIKKYQYKEAPISRSPIMVVNFIKEYKLLLVPADYDSFGKHLRIDLLSLLCSGG